MGLALIDYLDNRSPGILDAELAELVGCKTKRVNEAARRSTYVEAREPYRYQMTSSEWDEVRRILTGSGHLPRLRFRPKSCPPHVYSFEGACLVIGRLRINLSKKKKDTLLKAFSRECFPVIDYGEGRREESIRKRLSSVFDGLVTVTSHFPVTTSKGPFQLDIYLEEWNIAIEVDEIGHRWDQQGDRRREVAIREVLGCEFIRFVEDSDSDELINTILRVYHGR
ncbi:MAG: hypothetical protein ABIE42_03450 [Candidatus Eisenbacteria bacterium]